MNKKSIDVTLFPLTIKEEEINYNIKTHVVNLHHDKNVEHIYIGRGSKWGNPYTHLPSKIAEYQVRTRRESIIKYYEWIQGQPSLLAAIPELLGHKLGCYCSPHLCHGDILALLADTEDIGESILNNKHYYWSFLISENQYKIMDEKRLDLLAGITRSEYVCIKRKGNVSGLRYIAKDKNVKIGDKLQFTDNEETSFGPGVYLYDVAKSTAPGLTPPEYNLSNTHLACEVIGKDVWYLECVFSDEIDKNNELLISRSDFGIVNKIFYTQEELDNYLNSKRTE